MTVTEALQIAGQCWCDPETSNIEVDIRLANAIAKRLQAAIAKRLQAAYAAGRKAGLEAAKVCDEHSAMFLDTLWIRSMAAADCAAIIRALNH